MCGCGKKLIVGLHQRKQMMERNKRIQEQKRLLNSTIARDNANTVPVKQAPKKNIQMIKKNKQLALRRRLLKRFF